MKIRKERLPSSRKIKKYGPPYFRCKNMVCGQNKNMVCGQNIIAVHKCSDTQTHKHVPYYYPLAQQSCGGDIGSVPYVCTYVRSYVYLLSSL